MPKAIAISAHGGPEVLQLASYDIVDPKPHEVQIRHTAIEVNYIDIYHRTGLYKIQGTPAIPGISAVGEVVKVGADVSGFAVGDVVGYATASSGAYCEVRNIDHALVFNLPRDLDSTVLASCLMKALTAHFLACRVFIVRPAKAVLIHAAAGGVGRLLAQWCNKLGAYVIGTVGSDAKKKIALENGCHVAINYSNSDWVAEVKKATDNIGVHVVYDSVGQATFNGSLECLMSMGLMVLFGAASGPVRTIDTDVLSAKSLFFTRPTIFHYKANRMELLLSVNEVCEWIRSGDLKPAKVQTFPLASAKDAHALLESRQNTFSLVLTP